MIASSRRTSWYVVDAVEEQIENGQNKSGLYENWY